MKMSHRIMLIGGASVLVIGLGIFGAGVSWYNTAVSLEESTKAQYRDNQNQYDAFWKKVKETAQVPDKYKQDFKDIVVSETQAKFGPEGSKAAFQWFHDRNINLDASVYKQVQVVIESGRNDFKRGQTELLDKQRKYGFHLKSFWGRLWAGWYDMPGVVAGEVAPPSDKDGDGKLTVMDYDIVTSQKTKAAFASGEDEPVKVF